MCGIAGVSWRGERSDELLLRRLARALSHRGPNDERIYAHRNVGLAHRRLSIIDIAGGAQPIEDASGRWRIVCNGEIYNYRALRTALEREGVAFKTRSDTEPALHLFLKYGFGFVNHLEGMYALAIHDKETGDVVLARDPVGIKPLYVSEMPSGVAFASEAGALVEAGWCAPDVYAAALPFFFNRQYVGGADTLFAHVKRVRPGELIHLRDGHILERRIVGLPLAPPIEISEGDALEELDRLLTNAVESHLQSEVPYGAFLSGGIDSACVVNRMAASAGKVRTYTVGFSDPGVPDERAEAAALAHDFGVLNHPVEFDRDDFWRLLPRMCQALDDLVADYAALPTLKLAQTARWNGLSVILTGEGGDEIFAGYGRYRRGGLWDRLRGKRFRGHGDTSGFKALFRWLEIPAWRDRDGEDLWAGSGLTRLQRYQARDIADWLPDDLLLKVDRCLMAFGIEGRVPLLDRKLLGFAFGLPDRLKIRGGHGKYLLKTWLSGRDPATNVWEPKRGFTVPVRSWLDERRGPVLAYLDGHDGVREIVLEDRLRAWLDQPLNRRGAKLLFTLLCYAVWHDVHVRKRSLPAGLFGDPDRELPLLDRIAFS